MAQQLNDKFVIIAGVAKSGSTSLFEYLNAHSQVVGAYVKEPNYFLDPDVAPNRKYQSKWESKYLSTPIQDYYNVFPAVQNKEDYRLDGSIRYWSVSSTSEIIHARLPNAKLIFIFRNPVDRFISMYRYQKQMHRIPSDITIEQYVQGIDGHNQPKKDILASSKYADRLRSYWERFDHNNIILLGFSELKNNPQQLMQKVCKFLNIDDQVYENYHFVHHNETQAAKNMTLDRLQFNLIMPIYNKIERHPRLFNVVRAINRRTWYPLYQYLNGKSDDKGEISNDVRDYLRDYYKDEARLLVELTGVDGLLD